MRLLRGHSTRFDSIRFRCAAPRVGEEEEAAVAAPCALAATHSATHKHRTRVQLDQSHATTQGDRVRRSHSDGRGLGSAADEQRHHATIRWQAGWLAGWPSEIIGPIDRLAILEQDQTSRGESNGGSPSQTDLNSARLLIHSPCRCRCRCVRPQPHSTCPPPPHRRRSGGCIRGHRTI